MSQGLSTNSIFSLRSTLATGRAPDDTLVYGSPGDIPVIGDWNGDGFDSPGVYHPSNSTFYLADQVCNCFLYADHNPVFGANIINGKPVVGDWIGQGHAGLGIFDATNAVFNLRTSLTSGSADYIAAFGAAGDIPVAGHWIDACPANIANSSKNQNSPCIIPPTVTPTPTMTASAIPTAVGGTCSLHVRKPSGSTTSGLALRESPTINSPRLNTIPWTYSAALVATFRIDVGSDIWYQVNYSGLDGWIAASYGGLINVDNTGCSLPLPYPTNWPQIADIENNEIPGNCDIDTYFRTEDAGLVMARLAYAESATYGVRVVGADNTGGVVFADALRISWTIRMDAFIGLPNYGLHGVAGRSVSIVDQVEALGAYQSVTNLRSALQ